MRNLRLDYTPRSTVVIMAMAAFIIVLVAGCGGGGSCTTCTGAAAGWVYQPVGGGTAIISARSTPPAGYEPVPEGTVVRIEGQPDLTTTTDANGRYLIIDIPPGTQELVVEAPAGTIRVGIPIICNRITVGSGHEEGGSG
jgi:hypothetical protein